MHDFQLFVDNRLSKKKTAEGNDLMGLPSLGTNTTSLPVCPELFHAL